MMYATLVVLHFKLMLIIFMGADKEVLNDGYKSSSYQQPAFIST